jgi:hypothetical protein
MIQIESSAATVHHRTKIIRGVIEIGVVARDVVIGELSEIGEAGRQGDGAIAERDPCFIRILGERVSH